MVFLLSLNNIKNIQVFNTRKKTSNSLIYKEILLFLILVENVINNYKLKKNQNLDNKSDLNITLST